MQRKPDKQDRQIAPRHIIQKSTGRPLRTREHYIEAVSRNYIEGLVVRRGHVVYEPQPDYGYDIVVMTFDYQGDSMYASGEIENGAIYIQLKATDNLEVLADGDTISFPIKRRHAMYWKDEPNPVFLIVYSVAEEMAYWLHMQPYLKTTSFRFPPPEQKEFSIHLSKKQIVTETTIEEFRTVKQRILAQIEALDLYG